MRASQFLLSAAGKRTISSMLLSSKSGGVCIAAVVPGVPGTQKVLAAVWWKGALRGLLEQ